MGKAPFTMKGFSYPGKSPIRLVPSTALGASTPGGLDITTPVTTAGSADQVPIGGSSGVGITGHPLPTGSSSGSSGIDFGQTVRGAVGATLGFGGSGGGGSATNTAAGAIGGYFMGGIGSGLLGGLFGRRRRGRRRTTRGKRGYKLSADSWENTKPGYVSGATSFMTS